MKLFDYYRANSNRLFNSIKQFYLKSIKVIYSEANSIRFNNIAGHYCIAGFNKHSIIVDLGANRGEFSKAIIKKFRFSKLIMVEPDPVLIKELNTLFGDNDNIEIINAAVSSESSANKEFYFSKNIQASSLNKDIAKFFVLDEEREKLYIKTITLEDIFRAYGLKNIDLLKIDVESAEYEILNRLLKDDFRRIKQISVEFHDFIYPALKVSTEECIKRLKGFGYAFANEGAEYKNCLFYKNTLKLRILSIVKLFLFSAYLIVRLGVRFFGKLTHNKGLF